MELTETEIPAGLFRGPDAPGVDPDDFDDYEYQQALFEV